MSDTPDLGPTASLDRIDRLLSHWDETGAAGDGLRGRPGIAPASLLAVWGLTCHVHEQARLIRPLLDPGGIVLTPLVRSMFENALTAQWLVVRGPKALPGWLRAGAQKKVTMGKSMLTAGWTGMTPRLVDELQSRVPEPEELAAQARSFEQVLNDFQAGPMLYVVYRHLSGLSHPSLDLVDSYSHVDPENREKVSLRRTASAEGLGNYAWTVVWALVWSRAALDSVTHRGPARQFLDAVAREVGMPSVSLNLTEKAKVKAFQDTYEAQRRRPRGK